MLNVQLRFNNGSYENLEDWIDKGTYVEQKSALWLVKNLVMIEKKGQVRGMCLGRKPPIRVWHLEQQPCSLLYRDRKASTFDLLVTVDRAVYGSQDWQILGRTVLTEPNGP